MSKTNYEALSARLKVLAHPERLRILDVLRHDPECVCHLEALLGKPQPYVSQQLRLLREAGVICGEKQGQNVFYNICDPEIARWLDVVLGPIGDERALDEPVAACVCPKCTSVALPLAV